MSTENQTTKLVSGHEIWKNICHLLMIILILCGFILAELQITKLQKTLKAINTIQNEQTNTLTSVSNAIQKYIAPETKAYYILKESSLLINQASFYLKANNNIAAATDLLKQVNKNLEDLTDFDSSLIKQAIDKDLGNLQNVKDPNQLEVATKINDIITQIDSLPLVDANYKLNAPAPLAAVNGPETLWQKLWHYTLNNLKTSFVIRYHEQPLEPILSKEQQLFLKQSIEINLQQAIWALLQKRQDIYKQSLTTINNNVINYFAYNLEAAKNISKQVQDLRQLNIAPTIPDLTAAEAITAALQQIAERK